MKNEKMLFREFQYTSDVNCFTDVLFNLSYTGGEVSVTNIKLHSNFNTDLPRSVFIAHDSLYKDWRLCTYYNIGNNGGRITRVKKWLESPLALAIANLIIRIKEKEMPDFMDMRA